MIVDTRGSRHARLKPVAVSQVAVRDKFWTPRLETNRAVTIPGQYRQIEETGRLDNFRRAAGKRGLHFRGIFFNDSDVYKWAEAASWALSCGYDARLAHILNMVVRTISSAQQPDGYLNTYFMFEKRKERWTNLGDMHELVHDTVRDLQMIIAPDTSRLALLIHPLWRADPQHCVEEQREAEAAAQRHWAAHAVRHFDLFQTQREPDELFAWLYPQA